MSVERILWEEDATGLANLVRKGEVSAVELTDAAITRAEATRPDINATAEPLYDAARACAKTVDPSLPLAGVPFAIKDLGIAIKGVPTHGGSRIPAWLADVNSALTDRYLAAGLIPIVTSTSPEHGLRLMTESRAFGITRNPWNTGHTSGGSSGGSAALVAAGVVPVAHASDGGGSIRVPAACTGLVGLKTSRGRTPLTPLVSESWYGMVVDHALTRSVRDCALLLDLTHGPDPLSPYAAPRPKGTFAAAAARDPGKLSLAVYRKSPLGLPISDETLKALDNGGGACPRGRPHGRGDRLALYRPRFLRRFLQDGCLRRRWHDAGRSAARRPFRCWRHRAGHARARPLRRTGVGRRDLCRPAAAACRLTAADRRDRAV
ncbi:amidase [Mesorhizobium ciceri]|uniref:amidase n=1 Tax=Mesorhizobium ciceri TaxID=39645 RepID=UPI000311DCFA